MTSIGSLTGRLDPTGLWLDTPDGRVAVSFDANDVDTVWNAQGRRVQITGLLTHDDAGQLIRVRLQQLEILPEAGDALPRRR